MEITKEEKCKNEKNKKNKKKCIKFAQWKAVIINDLKFSWIFWRFVSSQSWTKRLELCSKWGMESSSRSQRSRMFIFCCLMLQTNYKELHCMQPASSAILWTAHTPIIIINIIMNVQRCINGRMEVVCKKIQFGDYFMLNSNINVLAVLCMYGGGTMYAYFVHIEKEHSFHSYCIVFVSLIRCKRLT